MRSLTYEPLAILLALSDWPCRNWSVWSRWRHKASFACYKNLDISGTWWDIDLVRTLFFLIWKVLLNRIKIKKKIFRLSVPLSYVYTLRLIGPISYPGKWDLMIHPRKHSVIFSRIHLLPSFVYNMHQDTKSARLIAVCKRSLNLFPVHR